MIINSQKTNYQSALQTLKSSCRSATRASKQASLIKKVALAVINLLLIPFRLAKGAYYKLFKIKLEPKTGLELNQPKILKAALIGIGAIGLIALGYKPSNQSSQIGFLSYIPKLALGAVSLYGIRSLILRKEPIDEIKKSEECRKVFSQVLNSEDLSPAGKLDSIKSQLQEEILEFEIADNQLTFAREILHFAKANEAAQQQLRKIDSINTNISTAEMAYQVNKIIISSLNFDPSLRERIESLDLSHTNLKKTLSPTGKFSNVEILNLDFRMLSADSIVYFVEKIRESILKNKPKIEKAD